MVADVSSVGHSSEQISLVAKTDRQMERWADRQAVYVILYLDNVLHTPLGFVGIGANAFTSGKNGVPDQTTDGVRDRKRDEPSLAIRPSLPLPGEEIKKMTQLGRQTKI